MSKKNITWGDNTSSYSSGVRHGIEDSTQGKKVQQLANSAQVMFGKTGDLRFLPYTGDAPSGEESMNLIENSGKNSDKNSGKNSRNWGGKKQKEYIKKQKEYIKKQKEYIKKQKEHIKKYIKNINLTNE
jgi:hypothetical protein